MRSALLCALLCTVLASPATGQARWTLTAEFGLARFSRAAHDTSTPTVSVGAWRSASYGLRLARSQGPTAVAVTARYASIPFAAWIENVAVLQGGELTLLELAPTLGRRLASSAQGAEVWVEAGPVFQAWALYGEDPRTRLGGLLGAVLELPVTERWSMAIRADLTLTSSWVGPEDESAEITRESSMRRGRLALGITRRL